MELSEEELQELTFIAFNALETALKVKHPHFPVPSYDFGAIRAPLFVTWKIKNRLRGCIGTFAPQPLVAGVKKFALTAALGDTRFRPVTASELPKLNVTVTLLGPLCKLKDPYDWVIGKHGVQAEFPGGLSATFLPEVAEEQEWTKDETIEALADKAGANSTKGIKLWSYEGLKFQTSYEEYLEITR